MERRLQAVYNDGVLQPLEALLLEDKQQVTVTITDPTTVGQDVAGYFSPEEWRKQR
jgi:predicted DNA-binding antitoxin AbrB/MazE fold protein